MGRLAAFLPDGVLDQSREAARCTQNLKQLGDHYHPLLAKQRSAKRLAEVVDFLIDNLVLIVHWLQAGLASAVFMFGRLRGGTEAATPQVCYAKAACAQHQISQARENQ